MDFPKFSMDELQVAKRVPGPRGSSVPVFSAPISSKENIRRMLEGKTPLWLPSAGEINNLRFMCDPENVARSPKEGIDGFGVPWVWVEQVGGPMVKPGAPICPDINEWEKYVTIPDPATWDWAACRKEIEPKLDPDLFTEATFGSCLFERLIAILDAAEALLALVDEDQQEAVHRFFRAITDYRLKYYEIAMKWFPELDCFNYNDDWGTQRAPFFSYNTCEEMLHPYVKEVGDLVHKMGCYFDRHCCGVVEPLVPLLIDEGFDIWGGQPINDKCKLKKMYADKPMVYTHELTLPKDCSADDAKAAAKKFMDEFGYDNRGFNRTRNDDFITELYILSRKNFDRMVEEGTAIL